ncbi:MAG: OsmC family protein [Nitrososphaerota archaeon]|jgi:uncharacterized OsmC-like protein|nr:OsmC family protein [Nitrososphaerota archaeon]MDG7043398.1 OsmC family protein [Nitrososphaerota archaeon]
MVSFSDTVVQLTKKTMNYVKEHEAELGPRTIVIQVERMDDFLSAARREGSEFTWFSDESKERGGQGKGASLLSYFLSAMGFCQFVHYAEHCIMDGIKLRALQMKIQGKIVMQRTKRFTEIKYEVRIQSDEKDETIISYNFVPAMWGLLTHML